VSRYYNCACHLIYNPRSHKKFTFEVGGKNKGNSQIKDIANAYIAADNIENGFANKIPLWLFGFLY
jgi:hypothetical protein